MIRPLAVLLALAGPGLAETARVYSGEHEDFTRLVVELPAAADWTVGRTPMGYAFAVSAANQPTYDISTVWARIPKSHLQALRLDPETGALQLTLACACHVFPFEYQPGVVVLDIKPGPAPQGSAFEAPFALAGQTDTPAFLETKLVPTFDWLEVALSANPRPNPVEIPLPTAAYALDPLRRRLIEEISRGAAQGVVDMTLPGKPPEPVALDPGTLPWAQIHIGPPPEARLDGVAAGKEGLTPEGEACIADDRLAVAEWGGDKAPLDLLAEARTGLYGEFDTLDPYATERAIKAHLYLGFGAEAGQYARLLPKSPTPEDLPLLQSLALLVDGETDPHSPFLDMFSCDGAAALWSAQARATLPAGSTVNSQAITRSFLALPAHLRRALGPGLAERLLDHGDAEAATIIRNALERTPNVSSASVALLDAKAALGGGNPVAALARATAAVAKDGSDIDEWLTLVEAHFRTLDPLTADSVETLKAFENAVQTPQARVEYLRAVALAQLLSGQIDAGFRTAEAGGLPPSDLWQVTAALAEDDAFLRHAVPSGPQGVGPDIAELVAKRLVALGFPDAALAWLGLTAADDDPEKRRLAARAEFARGDARRSLLLLAGLTGPEDERLRAEAMSQLGLFAQARTAYQAAGLADAALRLAAWDKAWPELAATGAMPWSAAATDPTGKMPADAGPLAQGDAILKASAASRAAIDKLLAGVKSPAP